MKYSFQVISKLLLTLLFQNIYAQEITSGNQKNSYNLLGIEEYKSKSIVIRSNDGKTLSLNPIKIVSEINQTYYVLKLQYDPNRWNLRVFAGDKIEIYIDGYSISLEAHNVHSSTTDVVAFYNIEMLDLIEIGNADSVEVRVFDKSGFSVFAFSSKNIINIRDFASEHILGTRAEVEKSVQQKHKKGFIGLGFGTGAELWAAFYDIFKNGKTRSSFGDFMAFGVGYTFFNYDILRIYQYQPEPQYFFSDDDFNSITYLNIMYGFTFPNILGNWPLDIALTAQYYDMYDKDWNRNHYFESGEVIVPFYIYEVRTGKPYQGFAIGIFIQTGSFWFRINHQKAWAFGFSFSAY